MRFAIGPVEDRRKRRMFRLLATLFLALAISAGMSFAAGVPAGAEEDDPDREQQVVGGRAVKNGKYQFMVSLQNDRPGTTPREDHFCGGTLVGPRHVLTAAHCAATIRDGTHPVRQLRVVVGRTKLNSRQGQVRKVRRLSHVRVHPRYTGRTFGYDVAVIRLDRPVRGIKPVRLDRARSNALERPGARRTVAGWGLTREPGILGSGGSQNRMREARPPIVSDRRADRAYGGLGPVLDFRPRIMVAAGRKGVDTCQGDSGGPLFARTGRSFTQIGVTSYGYGCARSGYPGVYAELSSPAVAGWVRRAAR